MTSNPTCCPPERTSGPAAPLGPLVAGLALCAAVGISAALQPLVAPHVTSGALRAFATVLVSLSLQALPFLVGGVIVSGAIAAFLPAGGVERWLPKRGSAAVAVSACAGMALPGCECGSVPISARLAAAGAPPAAALAFMLSAPAINPVVLVATAVAFPGQPEMVVGRLLASLATAIIVGLVWLRRGDTEHLLARANKLKGHQRDSRSATFTASATHDLTHAGGWLVVGAVVAAAFQTWIPVAWIDTLAGNAVLAVLTLAVLAVVLSICSEADAFIAASFNRFPAAAQLTFLVVGPVADLKLIAMHAGVYGRRFAVRFAPVAIVTAVLCAVTTAAVLL